jgi:hypothetical protein
MHRRAIQAAMRARNFDQAVSAWGNLSISLIDVGKPRAGSRPGKWCRSLSL